MYKTFEWVMVIIFPFTPNKKFMDLIYIDIISIFFKITTHCDIGDITTKKNDYLGPLY